MKYTKLLLLLLCVCLTGCGQSGQQNNEKVPTSDATVTQKPEKDTAKKEPTVTLVPEIPVVIPEILKPEAPGTLVKENDVVVIDYSNVKDGYVMVNYKGETKKRLKVQVKGPTTTYTYNISPGEWEAFPFSDGNGEYQVTVYENVEGTKYATVLGVKTEVSLADEFAPFLRPNQYVDYAEAENTIELAARITAGKESELEKVQAVYEYVIENITYDTDLAASVKSGYLPVLDTVLEKKTGICFDYAALMTGMLRSQSVPCKLVVGYAGEVYHAWISVYTVNNGWISNAIYFDGTAWKRMDPTFASSGDQSAAIMKYIGDGANYTEKYLY